MNISICDFPDIYTQSSRQKMFEMYRASEESCVDILLKEAEFSSDEKTTIQKIAKKLVESVREKRLSTGGIDAFMSEYHLSTDEGIALMCLAEALLRIPDDETADKLIRDKIVHADWKHHQGQSHSFFVNAATWALMLTGKIISIDIEKENKFKIALKNFVARTSEPVVRTSLKQAMKILGKQFVMGENIQEALKRAKKNEASGYRYSYDMLGEAAKTAEDAKRYFEAYKNAVEHIGQSNQTTNVFEAPGISIKLSALYPRYEFSRYEDAVSSIVPLLRELVLLAKKYHIGVTIDAEESYRLDLSLDIIEKIYSDPVMEGYEGFGLAVQSYQKRALFVIDWLKELAQKHERRIMIRLIKGAYWDSEIKIAQELGLKDYPVYTRKSNTDLSFLACSKKILENTNVFFPQFATHNAYSVAAILHLTKIKNIKEYEFQCLHGMGQTLYDEIVPQEKYGQPCRIYAPVGSHENLLAYLVRRLLENGANSSFVNHIIDKNIDINLIVKDPMLTVSAFKNRSHPKIPLPQQIYGKQRLNSKGIDFSNLLDLETLQKDLSLALQSLPWIAESIIANSKILPHEAILTQNEDELETQNYVAVFSPAQHDQKIGYVKKSLASDMPKILLEAAQGFKTWSLTPPEYRASLLIRVAELLEENQAHFIALLSLEAGKTLPDALAEVREAIDFCRYYAEQAQVILSIPKVMPGPTGEYNQLSLHGRGVAVCISPWNFPLAIFIGQITAALASGNTVIAKPADATSLIAYAVVKLMHEAGIPREVLQLAIGKGSEIGDLLLSDSSVQAVLFTGSNETAQRIYQLLAHRPGPIIPFIAETGGQNAMIVDSSALPEQVISDVILSAFGSIGQRCSALRVLYLQEDIVEKVLTMLKGAMDEIRIGLPWELKNDCGPVIDQKTKKMLEDHIQKLNEIGKCVARVKLSSELEIQGNYFAPAAYEISGIHLLEREIFGPVLHIIRYKSDELEQVIEQINGTGYGLTLGVHSRIQETVDYIRKNVHVGNCYINRSMIGAVVGVQPFGGEGLSGTGPKAGGPHYLIRLCHERTLSINTSATGGNTQLVSLDQNEDIL